MSTKIEWADKTVNVAWGCEKVSPGCEHCYAERISAVRASHPNPKIAAMYDGVVDAEGHWSNRVNMLRELPRLSGNGKRIFVGSMTDLFRAGITDDFLIRLWRWMEGYPQHTFQILTKRARRMNTFLSEYFSDPLPNVWLGVTVCNQAEADAKIPVLLSTPATVRFVSVEPMLGPVDLSPWDVCDECGHRRNEFDPYNDMGSPWVGDICYNHYCYHSCEGTFSKHSLDWVICGGETGPGARPMHPDWVRGLRDQCQGAGVPFFFKSWGEWLPCSQCADDDPYIEHLSCSAPYTEIGDDGITDTDTGEGVICRNGVSTEQIFRVGKRRSGRLLDGVEHSAFPEARP